MSDNINININLEHAREEEQVRIMKQIQNDKVCPFCYEHFTKYHTKPILFETEHWIVTNNAWPYVGTKHHFLLVSKVHMTTFSELTGESWNDLRDIVNRLESEIGLDRGTFMMRFGDLSYSGSTVTHLHAHLVVADSREVPVTTRLG